MAWAKETREGASNPDAVTGWGPRQVHLQGLGVTGSLWVCDPHVAPGLWSRDGLPCSGKTHFLPFAFQGGTHLGSPESWFIGDGPAVTICACQKGREDTP